MISIELKDKTYELPDRWGDVTIGKLQQLCEAYADGKDEVGAVTRAVSVLSGIPEEELLSLPYTEYAPMSGAISFMSADIPDKLLADFEFEGVTYSFQCDLERMTAAEYIDIETLSKDSSNANLHLLMAIMYRPKGEKYDSGRVRARALIFKEHMTVDYAVGAQVFTSVLGQACSVRTPDYSAQFPQQKDQE